MFSPRLLPSVSRGPYHLGSLWVPRQSLDNYSHARQRNSSAPHSHHAVPTRPIWKSFFVVCSFVCWALGQSNPIPSEVQQHLLLLLFFVLTITNFVGILLPFGFDTSSWPPVKPSSTWYSRPLLSVSPNFKPHNFLSFGLSLSPYKCWPVTAVFSLNVSFEPSQLYFLLENFARDYFIPLSPQRKKKVRFNCDSFGNNLRPFFSFRFIELCCGYQLGFACCPLFLKLSPGAGNKIIIKKKSLCQNSRPFRRFFGCLFSHELIQQDLCPI